MNKEQDQSSKEAQAKIQLLEALKNEPSSYKVTVIDNTNLPDKLKGRDTITFTIKPPTLATLQAVAMITEKLPPELFEELHLGNKALQHLDDLLTIIATLAHGNHRKPLPDWYVPFLRDNLTVQEALQLWFEAAQKIQTDFFLPFFQVVKRTNPMTMMSREDLIHTGLSGV